MNKIEECIRELDHCIDGLYRDTIEEKEFYREALSQEFKTLKKLLKLEDI